MSKTILNSEQIFWETVEQAPEDRRQYLATACRGDAGLMAQVQRLLESHEKNEASGCLLDHPPVALPLAEDMVASVAEKVGDTIGRYKLLEQIGEGGMGLVYMAEQTEDVVRRVALKIIKLGMDTRQVIARFEAERQAMALFDHPNITRVFDAGSTSSGRPFFVMELVRGTTITKYVTEQKVPLRERLQLFLDICNAIQHAHQKGIIHRDLKPSNVLVTMFDGVPVPKVIDFGIAKAIGQQRLTEKTLFTRYSAMVGTPQYMSPEQAELNGMDVDTRSDIYSLGVILYELITGTTPLSKEQLKGVNPLSLHETLRDADIETPSTRVSRIQSVKSEPATNDGTGRINTELDWVVMKALARDRNQRYASANELAADVARYLDNEPVLAAPPSTVYKLKTYYSRYKKPILSATAIASLLLVSSIACLTFALDSYQANRKLSSNIELLTANNIELEKTKSKLRSAADDLIYRTAISIASAKFEMEFQARIHELAENVFPDLYSESAQGIFNAPFKFDEDEDASTEGEDEFAEVFQTEIFAFEFCFKFDKEQLLDLKYRPLLETSIQRLLKHFKREEQFIKQIYDSDDSPADLGELVEAHEHSENCLKLQAETNKIVADYRPNFFRLLVTQYRKSFGAKDPHICEALNLLAASLIEKRKFNEAEAYLRESIAIGEGETVSAAKNLLAIVASLRANRHKK